MKRVGDIIQLLKQEVVVIKCEKCNALMVNIDQKELQPGDLVALRMEGVRISNPATKDPVCINCEVDREEAEHTFKRKVKNFFDEDDSDHDDDSHHSSDSGFFGGGSFGGGFGGFGGGSFSGGGATSSF